MKVNTSDTSKVITGIFKYDRGIQFTKGDFVINGDSIYYVKSDVNGNEDISDRSKYIEYSLINSVSDLSQLRDDVDKLVTSNVLKPFINKYIRGLNYGGEVESLDVSRGTNLDKFTYTCVYSLVIAFGMELNDSFPVIDTSNTKVILFRSFRSVINNYIHIMQELTDFDSGIIYVRSFLVDQESGMKSDDVYQWKSFYSIDASNPSVDNIINNLSRSMNSINNSLNLLNYYGMIELSGNTEAGLVKRVPIDTITDLNIRLIDIVITYKLVSNGVDYQDAFRVNVDLNNDQEIERPLFKLIVNHDDTNYIFTINYLGDNPTLRNSFTFNKLIGIRWIN